MISKNFRDWSLKNNILLDFIETGTPSQNAYIERFNRTFLLGATRHKLKQFLLSECDGSEFIGLFNRVVKRAKQKVKYGRQFSRADVGKPKRHHVFRRIC